MRSILLTLALTVGLGCAQDGPTGISRSPLDFDILQVGPFSAATAKVTFTVPPWPEAGWAATKGPVEILFDIQQVILAPAAAHPDSVYLMVGIETDGVNGVCNFQVDLFLDPLVRTEQVVTFTSAQPERGAAFANCYDSRATVNGFHHGTARVTLDYEVTGDTTGRLVADLKFEGHYQGAINGEWDSQAGGFVSLETFVEVEKTPDGTVSAYGLTLPGSGGGSTNPFQLPSGTTTLSCGSSLPAGYQCLTNSGGTVPVKYSITNFTNRWWLLPASNACFFWNRNTGVATMRTKSALNGSVSVGTAKFGVLVNANGTPIPDATHWYVTSIPQGGQTWDSQFQLLTFLPVGHRWFEYSDLRLTAKCPW